MPVVLRMALAFVISTLDSEEPEIAFYRFYSTRTLTEDTAISSNSHRGTSSCLFDSSHEKHILLSSLTKKVHMKYSLKLKQALLPLPYQDGKTLLKGYFMEMSWKSETFCVIWQGVPGIGFSLVCEKECNILHAQSVLDVIVSELEKYLLLLSYPTSVAKTIDSVALVVDLCIPGGQLLYLNSSLMKCIEKQLEINLQT